MQVFHSLFRLVFDLLAYFTFFFFQIGKDGFVFHSQLIHACSGVFLGGAGGVRRRTGTWRNTPGGPTALVVAATARRVFPLVQFVLGHIQFCFHTNHVFGVLLFQFVHDVS